MSFKGFSMKLITIFLEGESPTLNSSEFDDIYELGKN